MDLSNAGGQRQPDGVDSGGRKEARRTTTGRCGTHNGVWNAATGRCGTRNGAERGNRPLWDPQRGLERGNFLPGVAGYIERRGDDLAQRCRRFPGAGNGRQHAQAKIQGPGQRTWGARCRTPTPPSPKYFLVPRLRLGTTCLRGSASRSIFSQTRSSKFAELTALRRRSEDSELRPGGPWPS